MTDLMFIEQPTEQMLLNTKQAAKALSISPRYLQQLTSEGKLPHVKLGKRVLLDPADLRAWIARNKR